MRPRRSRALERWLLRLRERYLLDYSFVHINKTGGTSVVVALGLPFGHLTAREKIEQLGRERWDGRFTFAFVRNPWDRVASHYRYRWETNQTRLKERGVDFPDWVRLAYREREPVYRDNPKMFMPQMEWLVDDRGRLAVTFVGRFERLAEDFAEICRKIGRTEVRLPHLKSTARQDYRLLYDDDTREIVARCFERDIDEFGYRYE